MQNYITQQIRQQLEDIQDRPSHHKKMIKIYKSIKKVIFIRLKICISNDITLHYVTKHKIQRVTTS